MLKTLRRSEDRPGFLFFTTEQRAIGELMCDFEVVSKQRNATVKGYAAFVALYRDDESFRAWFTPINEGMSLVSKGDVRRLADIQRALVDLIDELNPKRTYTAGFDLEPIHLDGA